MLRLVLPRNDIASRVAAATLETSFKPCENPLWLQFTEIASRIFEWEFWAMTPAEPARIYLIPAMESPHVLILRRKPSKCFHVIRWNTKSDELEHGSWFHGKLFPRRCDVSFDGQWLIYLAMGANGTTWNGICRLPFLETVAEGPNMGTWYGGGYWQDRRTLLLNRWKPIKGRVPFTIRNLEPKFGGEDESVFYPRLERDGWKRVGENYGIHRVIESPEQYQVECVGDDGWRIQPSRRHPRLVTRYLGYFGKGRTFRFELEHLPGVLDESVDSACFDSLGNLVFSREGIVYKYGLDDLKAKQPGCVLNLEPLAPPNPP